MTTVLFIALFLLCLILAAAQVDRAWRQRAKSAVPPTAVQPTRPSQPQPVRLAGVPAPAPAEPSPAPIEPGAGQALAQSTRPRLPIVLVHGFLGFDTLGRGPLQSEYFRGVSARLRELGADVHAVRLPPLAGVRERAERLAAQVRALPFGRVSLVAHSMGGVDARYAISRLGLAERVAALVTIGTPHRGTPVANVMAHVLDSRVHDRAARRALGLDAVLDLTTSSMERFNSEVPDAPEVAYACCIASTRLLRSMRRLGDGLVPVESQRWGDVLFDVETDHWGQIGWSPGFDARSLYERIAVELARRGF